MPAVSQAQARFAGMCEHADHPPERCPQRGTLRDFVSTSTKNLPERIGLKRLMK